MKDHRFLASTVGVATIAALAVPSATGLATSFTDLTDSYGHYDNIMRLVDEGVIEGFPDGTFQPDAPLTRAQAAIMFSRALQLDVPEGADDLIANFSDVSEDDYYAKEVAALVESGITKGYGGYFAPENSLSREEMATMLVRAFALQDNGEEITLTDLDQVQSVHEENVKILFQNGVTKGKGDGSFGPNDNVTRGQFSSFMVRGLDIAGVSINIEQPDDVVIQVGESPELPHSLEVTLANGETEDVDVDWDTSELDTSEEGTYTVHGTLEGYSQKAEIEVVVENQPLQVEDVEMENLKQMIVKFNHSGYKKHIVENESHYEYENNDGDVVDILEARAEEDRVILTLAEPFEDEGYLWISSAIDGEERDYELEFRDTTPPEVEEVIPVSEDTIKVLFSEPMDTGTDNGKEVTNRDIEEAFELEDERHRVTEIRSYHYGQALNITFNRDLEEGDYTLDIGRGITDYFGFVVENDNFDFEMAYDSSDPEVVEIKDIYPTQATVVFNKDIKLKSGAASHFQHSNGDAKADEVNVINGNEVVVTFPEDQPLPEEGEIEIDRDAVEDYWGNENRSLDIEYEIHDDGDAPAITRVSMLKESQTADRYVTVEVYFSEPVTKKYALSEENYEVVGDDGKSVRVKTASYLSDSNGQAVRLVLDKRYGEFKNQEYTLYVDDIEDYFGTSDDELTYTFDAGSMSAPNEFTGTAFTEDDDEVRFVVDFGREMQTGGGYGIEQLNMYEVSYRSTSILLNELDQTSGFRVDINTYDDDSKAEIIIEKDGKPNQAWEDLFEDLFDAVEADELEDVRLTVGRVADQDGVRTNSFSNQVELDASHSFTPKQDEVEATALDELQIELAYELYDFDDDDLIVYADENNNRDYDDGKDTELDISVEYEDEDDTPYIYIYLDDELDDDLTYDREKVYVTTIDEDDVNTTNRFGQKLFVEDLPIVGGIAAQLEESNGEKHVYAHALKGEDDRAVVSLEFTNDIDDRSVSYLSFTISNGLYPVRQVYVDGDTVYLEVDLDGGDVDDLIGEYVEQQAPIADENDNRIRGLDLRINDVQEDLSESRLRD
ncbi:hypothetical protein G4V62_04230 [Bacillaceae bacterium SIJ1]|uniref:S-layer homology domain-containing protein n=1 Tax=Litoribacterium kuwaitense TaxID=1398745 RepID=UPI0013EB5DB3|nr:S-layer homology domain-containing protein [Litoribacterium kuwaitense]NGP44196.1 hypothetical protein [Litoribacterium kuwaitense]